MNARNVRPQLLLNEATACAQGVSCISVECHPAYRLGGRVPDFARLGFDTPALAPSLRRRASDCAIGVRRQDGA